MTISVVLACCRGGKFLAGQLESIENQTLAPDEILVCDDSPDEASSRIAGAFPRVRVLRNCPALGVAKNFARGIAEASGEVIFLSDQDDVWLPERAEHMMKALGNGDGVFCNSTLTDESLHPLKADHWTMRGFPSAELREMRRGSVTPGRMRELFARRVLPAAHDMMFRASVRDRILPMPDLEACHDSWIGLAVASCGRWVVCDEELTLFRQHGENLSGMGRLGAFAEARKSIRDNTFDWNARLYRAAFERFGIPLWEERALHSAVRAKMAVPLWKRFPMVWREWSSGRYSRFGRGWKNAVQDLFLRPVVPGLCMLRRGTDS